MRPRAAAGVGPLGPGAAPVGVGRRGVRRRPVGVGAVGPRRRRRSPPAVGRHRGPGRRRGAVATDPADPGAGIPTGSSGMTNARMM